MRSTKAVGYASYSNIHQFTLITAFWPISMPSRPRGNYQHPRYTHHYPNFGYLGALIRVTLPSLAPTYVPVP